MFDILLLCNATNLKFPTSTKAPKTGFCAWAAHNAVRKPNTDYNRTALRISILNCATAILLICTLYGTYHQIEWPCYNINDCAVWLLSWNHITIAIAILVLSVTYRRDATLQCIWKARQLSEECRKQYRNSLRKVRHYCVTILMVFCAKILVSWESANTSLFLLYNLSYLVPFVMECTVIVLCLVVRDTCAQINETLETLNVTVSVNVVLAWNLKMLMDRQQRASNLLQKITISFDKDLLCDLAFNMVWFIVYIYITTLSLWKYKDGSVSLFRVLTLLLEVLFLTYRVCVLSCAVKSIEDRKWTMLIKLRQFQQAKLDNTCIKLVKTKIKLVKQNTNFKFTRLLILTDNFKVCQFLHQVENNDMRMQICGCFYVDMSFISGIISLATTYLVVFIQYGLGGEQPSAKPRSNVSR